MGLNFPVFADQQLSAKVSSCKNLDQSGNESAVCKTITEMQKWRRSAMATWYAAKTSTEAIDYINTTGI